MKHWKFRIIFITLQYHEVFQRGGEGGRIREEQLYFR